MLLPALPPKSSGAPRIHWQCNIVPDSWQRAADRSLLDRLAFPFGPSGCCRASLKELLYENFAIDFQWDGMQKPQPKRPSQQFNLISPRSIGSVHSPSGLDEP